MSNIEAGISKDEVGLMQCRGRLSIGPHLIIGTDARVVTGEAGQGFSFPADKKQSFIALDKRRLPA
jgi:hypothetical protein